MYRKLYIYVHHADLKETMMDTLISTYYYLDLELIKILVLISCPMYLFVPHPPTHDPRPTNNHMD